MVDQDGDHYNLETIRQLLLAAFTAEELRRFCQSRPTFRPILDNFGPRFSFNDMVDEVLFYCEVHTLLDELLLEIQKINPGQYARFQSELEAAQPEAHRVAALRRGHRLLNGKYHILELIAQGGTGFVYLAHDVLLNERVAIKELIPALVSDEQGFRRFLIEARASKRLDHPHIVKTRDVFQEGRNYYMVMEYLSDGSLEGRLQKRKQLTVEEAIGIAEQVCDGLAYAHEHGVIHCDLKPANILFGDDGTAKITDFGAAHVSSLTVTRSWRSVAGFVAGTLPYMSPEQTEGVRDDPRVDIYALGAIVYRMLTWRTYLEFDDREVPRAQAINVERICNEQPVPPSVHNRRVPAWLDQVVLKTLAKSPDERFTNVAELLRVIKQGAAPQSPAIDSCSQSLRAASPTQSFWKRGWRFAPPSFWLLVATAAFLVPLLVIMSRVYDGGDGRAGVASYTPTTDNVALVDTLTPHPSVTVPTPIVYQTPISSATNTPIDTITPEVTNAGTAKITLTPTPTDSQILTSTQTLTPTTPSATQTPTSTPQPKPTAGPTVNQPPPAPTRSTLGRIAFVSNRDGNNEIYVMNSDGSEQHRLTNNEGTDLHPVWSPDGNRIAFASSLDGPSDIYVMRSDGIEKTNLTKNGTYAWDLSWSPDGKYIAFSSSYRFSPSETGIAIYAVATDGSGQVRLLCDPIPRRRDTDPSWSPDSKRIVFSFADWSQGNPTSEIWITSADRGNRTYIGIGSNPAWSPLGNKIAFTYLLDSNYEIYSMNIDGSDWIQLSRNAASDTKPTWSPDGSRIAFVSDRDGNSEIYIMNADGSGQTRLTTNSAYDGSPSWSP